MRFATRFALALAICAVLGMSTSQAFAQGAAAAATPQAQAVAPTPQHAAPVPPVACGTCFCYPCVCQPIYYCYTPCYYYCYTPCYYYCYTPCYTYCQQPCVTTCQTGRGGHRGGLLGRFMGRR